MAIVNVITMSPQRRDDMTTNRNTFASLAYVFVLGLALILFLTVDDAITQFRIITFTAIGLGYITFIFYMINIQEAVLEKKARELDNAYKK